MLRTRPGNNSIIDLLNGVSGKELRRELFAHALCFREQLQSVGMLLDDFRSCAGNLLGGSILDFDRPLYPELSLSSLLSPVHSVGSLSQTAVEGQKFNKIFSDR